MRVFLMVVVAFLLTGCGGKVSNRTIVIPKDAQRPALIKGTVELRFGLYEGGEDGAIRQLLPPVHDVVKVMRGYVYVHVFEAPHLRRYKLHATAGGWSVGKAEDLPYTHLGNGRPWLNHTDPSKPVWPYLDPRWVVEQVPGFLVKADAPGGFHDRFDWTKPGEAALIVGDQILPLGRLAEAPASLHGKRWVVVSGAPGEPTSASILDLDGGLVAGPFAGLRVADTTKGGGFGTIERKVVIAHTAEGGWRPLDADGRPYHETGLVEMRLSGVNSSSMWEQTSEFVQRPGLDSLGWELTYRANGIERFGFARGDLGVSTGPRWLALEHEYIHYRHPQYGRNTSDTLLIHSPTGWLPCLPPSTHNSSAEPDEPEPLTPVPFAERAEAVTAAVTVFEERAQAEVKRKVEQRADNLRWFEEALAKRDRSAARDLLGEVGGSAYARFYLTFGGTEADFTDALTRTADEQLIAQVHERLAEMKVAAAARREADEAARVAEAGRWKEKRAAELRADAKAASLEFDAAMNGASGNGAGFDIATSDASWFSRRAAVRERIQKEESSYESERNAYMRTRMGEARYLEWKALPAP